MPATTPSRRLRRRLALLVAIAVLAGCARKDDADANRLSVRSATIASTLAGPVLELSLDRHLGATLRAMRSTTAFR